MCIYIFSPTAAALLWLVIAIGSLGCAALNFADECNMFFVFALSLAQQDKIRSKIGLPAAIAKIKRYLLLYARKCCKPSICLSFCVRIGF